MSLVYIYNLRLASLRADRHVLGCKIALLTISRCIRIINDRLIDSYCMYEKESAIIDLFNLLGVLVQVAPCELCTLYIRCFTPSPSSFALCYHPYYCLDPFCTSSPSSGTLHLFEKVLRIRSSLRFPSTYRSIPPPILCRTSPLHCRTHRCTTLHIYNENTLPQ